MLNGMQFVKGPFVKPRTWGVHHGRYEDIIFGSDPEFFVKKGGIPVVPKSILEKKVDKKRYVHFNGTKVFGDGPAFEVEVPVTSYSITKKVGESFRSLSHFVERNEGRGVCAVNDPQVEFDKNYWETVPDFVKEIGCNPDIYLWPDKNGYWISEADPQDLDNVRYAGGHVHISFINYGEEKTKSDSNDGVYSDYHYYMASVAVGLFVSEVFPRVIEYERKTFGNLNYTPRFASRYGVPVLCRLKPYGVEIRSPSAWMLTEYDVSKIFNEALIRTFFDQRFENPDVDFTDVPYGDEITEMVKKFRKDLLGKGS